MEKNINEINEKYANVGESLKRIRKLKRKKTGSKAVNMENDFEIFAEYGAMLTLSSIMNFGYIEKILVKERQAIKEVYDFVGEIDALIAVSSFIVGFR